MSTVFPTVRTGSCIVFIAVKLQLLRGKLFLSDQALKYLRVIGTSLKYRNFNAHFFDISPQN